MDSNKYEQEYMFIDEIFISEVVFDEGDGVSLFCFLNDQFQKKLVRWDLFSDFRQLTDILLTCGEKGEEVIEIVSNKLQHELEIPTVIDLEDQIDCLLKVDELVFKVCYAIEKDQEGNWHKVHQNCLIIEDVLNKVDFLAENSDKIISVCNAGKIIANSLEYKDADLLMKPLQEELNTLLITLDESYKLFQSLICLEFTTEKAREMSGLANEFLFRIATSNNMLRKQPF